MDLIEKSIQSFFREQATKYPDRLFMEYFGDKYTYLETDLYSDCVSQKLKFLGIHEGDRVALWSENSPIWIIYFLALVKLGAIPVLINTSYKADELEAVLIQAKVNHILYGTGHKEVSYKNVLYSLRIRGNLKINNFIELPQSIRADIKGREPMEFTDGDPKEPAIIMFTSGSTKIPKGVLLTHYSLVNNARSIVEEMKWTKEDRLCLSVPLFHCFGLTSGFLAMVAAGGAISILNIFRTRQVLECIEHNKCTILNGVPSMFLSIIRNPVFDTFDVSSLKTGIIAGSPVIPQDYMNIVNNLNIKLQQSYGQTETSPLITISGYYDENSEKSMSAGKVAKHQELRIRNIITGAFNGPNKTGEIEVKGYNVMVGYDGLPEETKAVLSEDGWLKTGDLGFINDRGDLQLTGRRSEIIIRGGENIAPLEIESCIMKLKGIEEVKVFSIPDPVMNEEIAAAVVIDGCFLLSESDVKKYVRDNLADFKIPKVVYFLEHIPKLENGKINLRELRKVIEKYKKDC